MRNITFQDDLCGDGIIFNKDTKEWFATEHVSAMDFKNGPELPKGEDRILMGHQTERYKRIKKILAMQKIKL